MKYLSLCSLFIASVVLTSCTKKDDLVTINTLFGDIVLILFDQTPQHKNNFIKLANEGFYDSLTFHRIMDGFMIQGGDPNSKDNDPGNDGTGGPGYTTPAEFSESITHVKGAVAAARQEDSVNPERASSGSQFYIVEGDQGAHFLDGAYTVFGQVISGLEVVEEIAIQPKDGRDRPLNNIVMSVSVKKISREKVAKEYGYEYPE